MNFKMISRTYLFRGCKESDIEKMMQCLEFTICKFKKGDMIYLAGNVITDIGVVLYGSVQIENHDVWGNRSILNVIEQGGTFAEAYACIPNEPLMVDVTANEDCEVLFINVPKIFQTCVHVCSFHNKLIQNLVIINAKKNLELSQRIFHTSSKTIRGRLLSYFSQQISMQGSHKIVIPFDRQQLADYLSLDRSALSKELSKMQRDGLLEYHKNQFEIKLKNV